MSVFDLVNMPMNWLKENLGEGVEKVEESSVVKIDTGKVRRPCPVLHLL